MAKKPKVKKAKKTALRGDQSSARKSGVLTNPIRNLIITAIVSALLGAAFIVEPTLVYTYCTYVIGGLVGLIGLVYLIIYFCRKPVSGVYRSEFALGVLALLAGAYVAFSGLLPENEIANISFTLSLIVRIVGILIALDGLLKLQYALDLARMRYSKWWLALIFSLLGIAVGVLTTMGIIYNLGDTLGVSGMLVLGAGFCVNALIDLIVMIIIAVRNHKANKADSLAAAEAMAVAAKGGQAGDFTRAAPGASTTASGSAAYSVTMPVDPPAPVTVPAPAVPEPATIPEPEVESEPFEPELPDPVSDTPEE